MSDHAHPVDPERIRAARARLIDSEEAARLAGLLGLLADPTRVRILMVAGISGVQMGPGATLLARMPFSPSICARLAVKLAMAAWCRRTARRSGTGCLS